MPVTTSQRHSTHGAEVWIVQASERLLVSLFSLARMPPEVAVARDTGERTAVADDAADVWALGLLAIELLSNLKASAFSTLLTYHEEIMDRLCGRQPLPWEEGGRQPLQSCVSSLRSHSGRNQARNQ